MVDAHDTLVNDLKLHCTSTIRPLPPLAKEAAIRRKQQLEGALEATPPPDLTTVLAAAGADVCKQYNKMVEIGRGGHNIGELFWSDDDREDDGMDVV